MRITDILAELAQPETTIIDATGKESALSSFLELPGHFGVRLARVEDFSPQDASKGRSILVREGRLAPSSKLPELGEEVVQVALYRGDEELLSAVLGDEGVEAGWEIVDLYGTSHATFRIAMVLARASETNEAVLRSKNELQIMHFICALHEKDLGELRRKAELFEVYENRAKVYQNRSEQSAERLAEQGQRMAEQGKRMAELHAEIARLQRQADDYAQLRQNYASLVAEHEKQVERNGQHEAHTTLLVSRLNLSHQRLQKSRESVSFRVGRAATVSVREVRKRKLAGPKKWLETFRGPDEILGDAERARHVPLPPPVANANRDLEFERVERANYLRGVKALPGVGPSIAGIASFEMSAQLGSAVRYRELSPNAWRYLLERDTPSYVLVCSDGLQPNTAWGDYGVPDGRGAADLLRKISRYCQEQHLPMVFWDTKGVARARLGAPRGVHFDAVFTVSRALVGTQLDAESPAAELLQPGVASKHFHPIGLRRGCPRGVAFDISLHRSLARSELRAREAILSAPLTPETLVLDASLAPRASLYKEAGIVACGHALASPDFPSWHLLAALASGASVLSTPLGAVDPVIRQGISIAASNAEASEALQALLATPLLSRAGAELMAHVSNHYDLGARLDHIAHKLAGGRVSPPSPQVGLFAHVASAAELTVLQEALAGMSRLPSEVHVVSEDEVEVRSKLGELGAPLFVYPSKGRTQTVPAVSSSATHLICWEPTTTFPAKVVELLSHAARISAAELVAIEESNQPELPGYRYGSSAESMVLAIRKESFSLQLYDGSSLVRSTAEDWIFAGEMRQLVISLQHDRSEPS